MRSGLAKTTKKEAILVAALEELSRRGFHGARIERIASSAGANKQLIFHYFGSKDGLYVAAVSHMLSTAPNATGSAPPPEALWRFADDLQRWLDANPGSAVMLAECLSGVDVPEAAASSARAWLGDATAAIRSIVDDGQRKGHFRDDIDHAEIVKLIVGTTLGGSLISRIWDSDRSPMPPAKPTIGRLASEYCAWR